MVGEDAAAEPARLELERAAGPGGTANGLDCPGIDDASLREAQVRAVVGAFLGVVSWWLETDDEMSADSVDRIFQRLAPRWDPSAPASDHR